VGAEGDYPVGAGHDFGFNNWSFGRFHLAGPGLHLDEAQRMEGNDVGYTDLLGQLPADP